MDSVRTVSDTKREFYSLYTRPIDSIYRRIIEELMVEMHLLSVNADFKYDAIYALGVVTTFDRFMEGYRDSSERDAIFQALCQATGRDVEQHRQAATSLLESLAGLSPDDLTAAFKQEEGVNNALTELFTPLAQRDRLKYSRLFGIGIGTIMETIAPDLVEEREKREALLASLSQFLKLGGDKLQRDVELYRGNLEKMKLARETIAEAIIAERKKRDQRQAELTAKQTEATDLEATDLEATEAKADDDKEDTQDGAPGGETAVASVASDGTTTPETPESESDS